MSYCQVSNVNLGRLFPLLAVTPKSPFTNYYPSQENVMDSWMPRKDINPINSGLVSTSTTLEISDVSCHSKKSQVTQHHCHCHDCLRRILRQTDRGLQDIYRVLSVLSQRTYQSHQSLFAFHWDHDCIFHVAIHFLYGKLVSDSVRNCAGVISEFENIWTKFQIRLRLGWTFLLREK